TIFGLEPIRLTDTDAQVACNVLFREMAVDPFFNDHNAFQFVLCQGDLLLAHTDIFSERLHPDNITAQRHFNPSPVARFRKIHYNKMIIVNDYSFAAESGPFSAAPDRRKPQQQPAPIWNGGEGDEHFGATKGYPSDHPAHSLSHRSRQRLPGGRRFAHPGGRRTENGG